MARVRTSVRRVDHVAEALGYCADVISGKTVSCKRARQACERHLRDVAREPDPAWPYRFDAAKAQKACERAELLPHVKGRWARPDPAHPNGNPIRLEPWQKFILVSLFGWVKKSSGFRRFRKASIYVPRKNGKSTLSAAIGWLMFAFDNEPGAEVYSGATSEKQAWEVFGPARQMAVIDPRLPEARGVTINAKSLVREADNAKFEPVIGKPGDGSSPHCAIIDEYHEHPTSVSYDTMLTGMGAREQPLLLVISTAGDMVQGPCRDDWNSCEKILDGTIEDETQFAMIFTVDDGDDWTGDAALLKANPNFDVSVGREFLFAQRAVAIRDARAQGVFKIKHLNVWVTARNAYFNLESWRKLANPRLRIEDFAGAPCVAALDLAAKVDICVIMQLFRADGGRFACFGRYFLPQATVELPENQHYAKWRAERRLIVHDGERNDFGEIAETALAISRDYELKEAVFDPDGAAATEQVLQDNGVTVIEVPQSMVHLSDPMKELDAMIKAGQIEHDGDPILEWAISNVVTTPNHRDQVYPTKERPENKIDPAVALIMAIKRRSALDEDGGVGIS